VGESHPITASVLESLAAVEAESGDYATAESMLRRSLEIRRETAGRKDDEEIASTMTSLAQVLVRVGRLDEAAKLFAGALAIRKRLHAPADDRLVEALHQYALFLISRGRYAEAESLLRESLEHRRGEQTGDKVELIRTLSLLSVALTAQGKAAEAEPFIRESLKVYRSLPPGSMATANAGSDLGDCLIQLGRQDEGEALLKSSYATFRRILGDRHPRTAKARARLIALYEATGRSKEAAALRRGE
jgi:tetratricopeptide (TPR) repeat protein